MIQKLQQVTMSTVDNYHVSLGLDAVVDGELLGYGIPQESCTVIAVANALKLRAGGKIGKLAKEHRNALWKARKAMAGIQRALKLKTKLDAAYMVKIPMLLNEATARGVTELAIRNRYGWIELTGKLSGRDVKGHIWSDLRGPVLDLGLRDRRMPVGARGDREKPILRIKAFSKVFVEDRSLDMILEPESKPEPAW